jgi:carbamate kinase
MRILAALGGNALMRRGERADVAVQLRNLSSAVPALARLAGEHELVLTHGNGPQVGLLARESALDRGLTAPYPLDTLGAEAQGMIGYWLVRELAGALPGRELVAVLTQTLVDADDPAFRQPTTFIGPLLDCDAVAAAVRRGWSVDWDGQFRRRVVASPVPRTIVELPVIRRLVDDGVVVVAAGGGGVPVVRAADGSLHGVEAVVDKDAAAAVLARELDADLLLLLTDVAGVFTKFGTPDATLVRRTDPRSLLSTGLPAGSMGPKVAAACGFVAGGGRAAIGDLSAAEDLVAGTAGTQITRPPEGPIRAGPRTLPAHRLLTCDGERQTKGGVNHDSVTAPPVQ